MHISHIANKFHKFMFPLFWTSLTLSVKEINIENNFLQTVIHHEQMIVLCLWGQSKSVPLNNLPET